MLLFCYAENYDDNLSEEDLQDYESMTSDRNEASRRSVLALKKLSINASMYALADKYAIESLKILAWKKFEIVLKHGLLPTDFASVARHVYSTTPSGDRGLRDFVVDWCMDHLNEVLEFDAFNALLEEEAQLSHDLLRSHLSKHQAFQAITSARIKIQEQQIINLERGLIDANNFSPR